MNSSSGRSILILLIVLLVSGISAFGQPKLLPPPDFVKVADQPGSPLTIALPERHEFGPYFNPVSYTIRNDSQKSIRSVVVTGFPKDPYHAVGLGSLQPGATRSLSHGDLNARKPDEMFTLSVDFVLFTDGTRWGADKAGESEFVFGFIDGQRRFYDDAKKVIDADDEQALIDFLAKPGGIPEFGIPPEKRSKRQDGFARGFSYWKNTLAFDVKNRGNLKGAPAKIADLELELGVTGQQKYGVRRIGRSLQFHEPVKLTELRLGDKAAAFDENYVAISDWLKGLSITVRNQSEKVIVHLLLRLDFPETTKTGNMMTLWVRYGIHPNFPQLGNSEERPVGAGESFLVRLDEKQYISLKRFVETRQPLDSLSRATVTVENVYYSDGTMWSGGQLRKPDPENPTRWIPISE